MYSVKEIEVYKLVFSLSYNSAAFDELMLYTFFHS